jgi:hypothetical protein
MLVRAGNRAAIIAQSRVKCLKLNESGWGFSLIATPGAGRQRNGEIHPKKAGPEGDSG